MLHIEHSSDGAQHTALGARRPPYVLWDATCGTWLTACCAQHSGTTQCTVDCTRSTKLVAHGTQPAAHGTAHYAHGVQQTVRGTRSAANCDQQPKAHSGCTRACCTDALRIVHCARHQSMAHGICCPRRTGTHHTVHNSWPTVHWHGPLGMVPHDMAYCLCLAAGPICTGITLGLGCWLRQRRRCLTATRSLALSVWYDVDPRLVSVVC